MVQLIDCAMRKISSRRNILFASGSASFVLLAVLCNGSQRRTADGWVRRNLSESAHTSDDARIGHSTSTTLLLGIFSTLTEDEKLKRSLMRDTYLADPRFCSLREFQNANNWIQSSCKIPYAFVVGGNDDGSTEHAEYSRLTLDASTLEEDKVYGDVIHLNIRETMEEGKSVSWMKYGATISGVDYIAKADSDTLFYPDHVFQMIERDLPPAPYNQRIYGGKTAITPELPRESIYAEGQFYFMSSDLALYVSNTLSATQREILSREPLTEDIDMSTFIFSHPRPIRFVSMSHHRIWVHQMKKLDNFRARYDNMKAKGRVKVKSDITFHFEWMCRSRRTLGQM